MNKIGLGNVDTNLSIKHWGSPARPSLETRSESVVTQPARTCQDLRKPAQCVAQSHSPSPHRDDSEQHNPFLKFNFSPAHSVHKELRKAYQI